MKTFLEYMYEVPSRRESLTRQEVQLLLGAREKLMGTEFSEDLYDNTSDLETPYLWVKLPKDVGGGARIYIIFGSLSIRLQKDKNGIGIGPAYKVKGLKDKHKEEKDREKGEVQRTVDRAFNPDYSALDRLHGELQNIVKKVREWNREQRKAIFSSPGQSAEFRGFWDENPNSSPLY